jgi:hypothetical protein
MIFVKEQNSGVVTTKAGGLINLNFIICPDIFISSYMWIRYF